MSFESEKPMTTNPAAMTPNMMMHEMTCPNSVKPTQATPAPT